MVYMYFLYYTFREFNQFKWKPLALKSLEAVKAQYFCLVPSWYQASRDSRIFCIKRKLWPKGKPIFCYGLVEIESWLACKVPVIIIVVQVHMILPKAIRKTSGQTDIFPLSTMFAFTFVFTLQICRHRDSQSKCKCKQIILSLLDLKKRISNSYTCVLFVFIYVNAEIAFSL